MSKGFASNSLNPNLSRKPEDILALDIIPPHMMRCLPDNIKPGPPSRHQKGAIRKTLNMRADAPFNRCKGIRNNGERCSHKAGQGTKGDFYGLGVETGCLGVFLCMQCLSHHYGTMMGLAVINARREVEMMQRYGNVEMTDEYSLKVAQEEVSLAKQHIEQRESVKLITKTLADFQKQLESTDPSQKPTELAGGIPVTMCDATRIKLLIDITKTLSRMDIDTLKLDATKYMLVDDVLAVMAQLPRMVGNAITLAEELTISKNVMGEELETDQPIRDYVQAVFNADWSKLCQEVQSKAGKRG